MNCNYKVKITDIQNKYQFKILCKGGANSTNVNDIYNLLPTTTNENTNITISNTADIKAKSIAIKGNTTQDGTPTPASPVDVKVVTGTNTINISNRNLSSGWEYGDIVSTTGVESDTTNAVRLKNYIPYDTSTTYRLSVNSSTPNASTSLRFYNKNKEYIGYAQLNASGGSNFTVNVQTSVSDTTPKYIRLRMANTVATPSDNIMLTNTSDLTYVAHQEKNYTINLGNIELCKIGTYQDYLYKENNKWYKYGAIGKVKLNGTQNIPLASGTPRRFNANYTALGIDNVKSGTTAADTQNNYRMCDHFSYVGGNLTWGNYYLHNDWLVMLDSESVISTANDLKTWFSNNPTTIYYVLATPTITEITDTTLIKQLNNIYNNIRTSEGGTNISSTSAGANPIINITTFNKLS